MANVSVYNIEGKEVGTIDLSDAVFGVEVNEHLLHMAVVSTLRQNVREHRRPRHVLKFLAEEETMETERNRPRKTGSTRAPQWTGGGIVFAPVPRDYSFKMNKKEKRAALKSALTSRVEEKKFIVVDKLAFERSKQRTSQMC